jgi:distribution and morphology protein 10
MFLPNGQLEALIARRASAHSQYLLSAFSCPNTHGPLQLTAQWIHDRGPWCTEVSYSTDDAMLGIRGLYNFYWPNLSSTSTVTHLFANTETPTDDAFADFSAHDASSKTSKSSSVSDRTTTRRMTHSIRRSTASARTTGVPTSRRTSDTSTTSQTKTSLKSSLENHHGIWSVGSEIYYSAKEKSGNGK